MSHQLDNTVGRAPSVAAFWAKPAHALALLYSTGFIIVNVHLARYAEVSGDLFRPKYLSAGLLFLLLAGIPAASAGLVYLQDYEARQKAIGRGTASTQWATGWRAPIRVFVILSVLQLTVYVLWSFLLTLVSVQRHQREEIVLFVIASIWGALGTWVVRDYVVDLRARRKPFIGWLNDAFTQFTIHLIGLLSGALMFSTSLYPNIAPQFGGGAAPIVRLRLEPGVTDSAAVAASRRNVGVVDRNSTFTFLLVCDSAGAFRPRTVAIRTDRITALVFETDSNPTRQRANALVPLGYAPCRLM